MAEKEISPPAVPAGTKYLLAWITTQAVGNAPWLLPWATNQIKAIQKVDATLVAPDANKLIYATATAAVSTVLIFLYKVWNELEADAVKGTAKMVRAMPAMAWELLGRCWDAVSGFFTRWIVRWGFTRKYLAELRYRHGLFNDKGLGLVNANRLDLDKVYVELRASPEVNLNRPDYNPVSREIRERAPIWEHLRALRPGFALAVIGAPGGGKTTLLQHVLLTFAKNRQGKRRLRFRVPFFIELRKVSAYLAKEDLPTLPELLETVLKRDHSTAGIASLMPKGWLQAKLKSGKCILLWDGLDEVADPDQRLRVRNWLDVMNNHPDYRANLCLVSARPAGYAAAPLERAQVLEVQPFAWEDTKRFIQQWYHATEVVSSGNKDNHDVRRRARDETADLLRRLQDSTPIAELSVNPLLLTMICMVHRYHGALPGSRSQLYEEVCQVLLERWRQQRGIEDRYSSQQKLEVLRPLAAWMMQQRTKEIGEQDMLSLIAEPLSRIGVLAGSAAAMKFVHDLRDSSGLWLERELGKWAFAHLSFQEFLCADGWARDDKARPKDWKPLLGNSWWRETLLLYAVKAADATPLAQAAIDEESALGRAIALSLMIEKTNLHVDCRTKIEEFFAESLKSRSTKTFQPAAEAWLLHQQSHNYHRIDESLEISNWVTLAEYQLFLLDQPSGGISSAPLHWCENWFIGLASGFVVGMSGVQADGYCRWLNRRFGAWSHRLPFESELAAIPSTDPILAWTPVDGGDYKLYDAQLSSILQLRGWAADTLSRAKTVARTIDFEAHFNLIRPLNLARTDDPVARIDDPIVARTDDPATDLARALDLNHALKFDVARARAVALDRTRTLALALGFDIEYVLDSVISGRNVFRYKVVEPDLMSTLNLAMRVIDDFRFPKVTPPYLLKDANAIIKLLRSLFEPGKTLISVRRACRRFWVACFAAVRERDPKLMTPCLVDLENAMHLLIAREEGKTPAWEGIRVVRERRK